MLDLDSQFVLPNVFLGSRSIRYPQNIFQEDDYSSYDYYLTYDCRTASESNGDQETVLQENIDNSTECLERVNDALAQRVNTLI